MAGARLAGAAALIAVLTVASRIAGFGRILVFTWAVGSGALGDLYQAANTIPNIIFEIVAGGALASLVVPILAGPLARGDAARVAASAAGLLTWAVTLLSAMALVVVLAAGPLVDAVGSHPDPTVRATGAAMLRIFAPQLPLYGVGIVLTGVLQAHRRFAWPVLAPLLSSVTVSGAYLLLVLVAGRSPAVADLGTGGLLILAGGTTVAVAVLTLSLVPPVARLGLRWRPTYRFGGVAGPVRRLALAGAVTVGSQQASLALIITLAFAAGSLVIYTLAQTVFLLPWAVLAVPIATSAFPVLAERHAAGDRAGFAETTATALRAVVLACAAGAAVLIAVAPDAATVLAALAREHPDPGPLADGLVAFAPGLLGYGLFALLSRVLYARQAPGAAAGATALGWAAVAVSAWGLSVALPPARRVAALGAGHTIGMLVLGGALLVLVYRRVGAAALAGFARAAGTGVVAAAAAVAVSWVARSITVPQRPGVPAAVAVGLLGAVVAVVTFGAVGFGLDRHDLRPVASGLLRGIRATRTRGRTR